jgi:hypothetical protein
MVRFMAAKHRQGPSLPADPANLAYRREKLAVGKLTPEILSY